MPQMPFHPPTKSARCRHLLGGRCRRTIWFAWGLVGSVLASGTSFAADPQELAMAGNDNILWVFQRQPEPDGTLLLRFAYRSAGDATAGRFFALRNVATGSIRFAAVRETHLHAIYRDGTHRRFTPRASQWEATPSRTQFNEITLPRAALPLALAADQAQPVLYALVTNRQAQQIVELQVQSAAWDTPEGGDAGALAVSPPLVPNTELVLVRYVHGQWELDRPGPADMGPNLSSVILLARNGIVHCLRSQSLDRANYRHHVSRGIDEAWSAGPTLPFDDAPSALGGGWEGGDPLVMAVIRRSDGHAVQPYRFAGGSWRPGAELQEDGGGALRLQHPFAVAVFAGRLAVAVADPGGEARLALWDPESRTPVEPWTAVTALARPPQPVVSPSASLLLQYAVLAGILSAIFIWRRDSVLIEVPLTPHLALAPLGRRAAALLIDVVLVFPFWGAALYVMVLRQGLDVAEFAQASPAAQSATRFLFLPVMGGIVGAYTAVMELVTRTTVGKRLLGLFVVGHSGKPCGPGAILVRNALRCVEFYFPPLVLLVALTPARQRLGDILARTVVLAGRVPDDTAPPTHGDEP